MWATPEDAGFDPCRLQRAWDVLGRLVGCASVPAAVAAVGRRGMAVGPVAQGWAVYAPEEAREPVRTDTSFDLASLTKVVGTASAVWVLIERGALRLEDRAAVLLPEFAGAREGEDGAWRSAVTVRHLLTHTSGLPAGRNLRLVPGGPQERLRAAAGTPLRAAPGERCVYSDLGFILLGRIVTEVSGRGLDVFCRDEVFAPLGMAATGWNPSPEVAARAAATEWAEGEWAPGGRAGYLRGTVHDENARALGGLCGHAGLFSTAADLAVFADALRAGGIGGAPGMPARRVLSAATVARMAEPAVVRPGECRTLGWQGPGRSGAPCGDLWTRRAFGHTGFTGTSLWIDPGHDLWAVLLTNAVHMGRAVGLPAMARLRSYFHNAVVAAVAG